MKLKVLFVDDDKNLLDSFRLILHSMRREWKCRFVTSAEQGLKLIEKEPYDVIIADMRMPGMDGADFLKEVEHLQSDSVRIILSGYSEMQAQLKSTKSAHQFLTKPCNSETVIGTIKRMARLRDIFTDSSIRNVVGRLDALPSMPDLILKIRMELEGPDPDLRRVGALVEQDAGTSATILKVVNSTFFGFYRKITSPSHAVILLGVEVLKGLVLGVHLLKELNEETLAGYSVDKLWIHSLQTGYFSKAIAAAESDDDKFIDCCFVTGLLHDIGKLVLITQMDSIYRQVLDGVKEHGGPIVVFEKQVLGVTHAEVGAYLLGLWGFNEDVVTGVYSHHSLHSCGMGLTPAHVAHVANYLQHDLALQHSNYTFSSLDTACLEQLDLLGRLDAWREKCSTYLEENNERA